MKLFGTLRLAPSLGDNNGLENSRSLLPLTVGVSFVVVAVVYSFAPCLVVNLKIICMSSVPHEMRSMESFNHLSPRSYTIASPAIMRAGRAEMPPTFVLTRPGQRTGRPTSSGA